MVTAARPIPPTFKAEWNETLKDPVETLCLKIGRYAWNFFSIIFLPIGIARLIGWAVHFIAQKLALPSSWAYSFENIRISKENFQTFCNTVHPHYSTQRYSVETPDGIKLDAVHFRHHQSNANTPTVLFFHSNASFIEALDYGWLIRKAIEGNSICNFVAFNYRGVISSEGELNSVRELNIDGDAVYQFVNKQLQVPAEQIRTYGWSLGGAVSSNIKALHPECNGPYCNIRSFDSSRSVADQVLPIPFSFWFPWALEKQGWNLTAPLHKVKGPMLIVYHRDDFTTPYEASAYKAAMRANLSVKTIELFQTKEQIDAAKLAKRKIDHHIEPLKNYYAALGIPADQAIADFILPPPAALQIEQPA